jgi:short-subunit dehydrogenase
VLSARDEERLTSLQADLPGRAEVVPCDVTDDASLADAAGRAGEIDGFVWLAGTYWPIKATEWDAEKIQAMCQVNFLGCVRALGHVVPPMVARNRGHIVLTGSFAAFRGLPGAVGYAASKAGVVNLGESLHADLRETGVQVQIANPGFIRTRMTAKNDFRMPFIMEPDAAAREMFELMNSDALSRAFPGLFGSVFRSGAFLPDWAFYRLFR